LNINLYSVAILFIMFTVNSLPTYRFKISMRVYILWLASLY